MLISENKLIIFAILGFIYLAFLGLSNEKNNIKDLIINNSFSMIIIFIIMYLISYISYRVFGINSLGIGDIKLSSISTIWLGIELSLLSLYISFLLSAIYSLHGKITKRFIPFQQYPFAPFISIGIFCSWIIDKI
jgi:leader peptidase (prepilin peptidase)/N-methyltransferase